MTQRGWTTRLLNGLAQHLHDAGVGVWHDPDAAAPEPYADGDIAITIGASPSSPDRCVVLASYPVSEDATQADVTVGVQVRTRAGADPQDVQDLDDAVFEVLHGATSLDLGGVSVVQILRRSSSSLGQARDQTGRWERSSNYYIDAMRPTATRPY
jgi:hypothetical protein